MATSTRLTGYSLEHPIIEFQNRYSVTPDELLFKKRVVHTKLNNCVFICLSFYTCFLRFHSGIVLLSMNWFWNYRWLWHQTHYNLIITPVLKVSKYIITIYIYIKCSKYCYSDSRRLDVIDITLTGNLRISHHFIDTNKIPQWDQRENITDTYRIRIILMVE
jgi:hypothetical protein